MRWVGRWRRRRRFFGGVWSWRIHGRLGGGALLGGCSISISWLGLCGNGLKNGESGGDVAVCVLKD